MKATEQLKDDFSRGEYANKMAVLYSCDPKETGFYGECFTALIDGFVETYGGSSVPELFSTPGRIEVGGNHTDHQNGCVLQAAVHKDMIAAAATNSEGLIHLHWPDSEINAIEVNNTEVNKSEYGKTESIVRGVAGRIVQMGFKITGLNIYVTSNIPKGFGLSSLAAFEVLMVRIMNHFFCKDELDELEMAKVAHYAQTEYYGKPSSLMDQIVCSMGGVVGIDFKDAQNPEIDKLDFNFDATHHVVCVIDSGAHHQDLALEYTAITREMHVVADYFGKDYLRDVELKHFLKELGRMRQEGIADRAILRAFHFFKESQRAEDELSALSDNNFGDFLEQVKESGLSSYMFLQNVFSTSSPQQQNIALALALCSELLAEKGAYRVHGAGFAGTVIAFVPLIELERFREGIEAVLGENTCQVVCVRQVGAVRVEK